MFSPSKKDDTKRWWERNGKTVECKGKDAIVLYQQAANLLATNNLPLDKLEG